MSSFPPFIHPNLFKKQLTICVLPLSVFTFRSSSLKMIRLSFAFSVFEEQKVVAHSSLQPFHFTTTSFLFTACQPSARLHCFLKACFCHTALQFKPIKESGSQGLYKLVCACFFHSLTLIKKRTSLRPCTATFTAFSSLSLTFKSFASGKNIFFTQHKRQTTCKTKPYTSFLNAVTLFI